MEKQPINTGLGKSRFTVVRRQNTEFVLILKFINYCIMFHADNCKPILAPPCRVNPSTMQGLEHCHPCTVKICI